MTFSYASGIWSGLQVTPVHSWYQHVTHKKLISNLAPKRTIYTIWAYHISLKWCLITSTVISIITNNNIIVIPLSTSSWKWAERWTQTSDNYTILGVEHNVPLQWALFVFSIHPTIICFRWNNLSLNNFDILDNFEQTSVGIWSI